MSRKIRLDVEGMTCGHCQAAVTSSLEALDGVSKVRVNLDRGSAQLFVADDVQIDTLVNAVSEAGYHANLEGQF